MRVAPIKTDIVQTGSLTLIDFIDKNISSLKDKSIVAVTSKVVSLCQGRAIPIDQADKQDLISKESSYYLNPSTSKYGMSFTITHNSLIPSAGIDESNGNNHYILWPKDPAKAANQIRDFLSKKFGVAVGVIITDSTCRPMHYGTEGMAIAFSGFKAINSYIGKPDLFGRPFKVSASNLPDSLASTAVLVMGEGIEQTPLAVIEDLPFVEFQDRNPSQDELDAFFLPNMNEDLFEPFLKNAPWQKGQINNE